jgi:hypothetical protein
LYKIIKKHIIIKLHGGLGNQLFQYSFARAYGLRNDCEVFIDKHTGFYNDSYKREYLLDQFKININESNSIFFKLYKISFIKKLMKLFCRFIFINEKSNSEFLSEYLDIQLNGFKIIQGYWQSPLYFNNFKEEIKDDLSITEKMSEITLAESKLINSHSVALCFRFFQEVENMERDISREIKYYINAIQLIEKHIRNPSFIIFCNDKKKAKKFINEYLPNLRNIKYISDKPNNKDAVQDLFLLTKCSNFILSPSTLHWWGAYLSENTNICIAGDSKIKKDITPEKWILLDA